MITRRGFLRSLWMAGVTTTFARIDYAGGPEIVAAREFERLPSAEFVDVTHAPIQWKPLSDGLHFARIEVLRNEELVDVVAAVRVHPEQNRIRVFNSYSPGKTQARNIEEWQRLTGALVMINSAQYMSDPYYMPCALVICDGEQKGPKRNKSVRGMLVAEPGQSKLPRADLLDFDFDSFDPSTTRYTQGVQHWPILLDRKGTIKVKSTDWQANRTVIAKDTDGNILFLTTEGGFFTLYHFGLFLKQSNQRPDRGLRIHTAMNLDGGYEADMIIRTEKLHYLTYGEFETYGPGMDVTVHGWKVKLPGVIGVFSR